VIALIVGARGAGKSTVGKMLESYGFSICMNEARYIKAEPNKGEKARDLVYRDAYSEVSELVRRGLNVSCEFTGTDKRWPSFKESLSEGFPLVVIKVECPPLMAAQRVDKRGWANHSFSSSGELTRIQNKSRDILFDFRVDNSGSLQDTEKQVLRIINQCVGDKNG